MNHEAVYRKAPATLGLLKSKTFKSINWLIKIMPDSQKLCNYKQISMVQFASEKH